MSDFERKEGYLYLDTVFVGRRDFSLEDAKAWVDRQRQYAPVVKEVLYQMDNGGYIPMVTQEFESMEQVNEIRQKVRSDIERGAPRRTIAGEQEALSPND